MVVYLIYLEVRLQDYGSKVIEVIDNGSGVEAKNIEGLSKLSFYWLTNVYSWLATFSWLLETSLEQNFH